MLTYALLISVAVVYIFPFLIQVATSFKTDSDAANNAISLIPETWTSATYQALFASDLPFPTWAMNSVIVTLFVTTGRVLFCSMAGYALARLHFRGRGLVFAGVIGVMAVPGVVLLIPKFLVVNQLGIYDSYAGMIIPLLADAAGVFIMKNFFSRSPSASRRQRASTERGCSAPSGRWCCRWRGRRSSPVIPSSRARSRPVPLRGHRAEPRAAPAHQGCRVADVGRAG